MIFIHLAEGFEEIEAITAADVLRRAGLDTRLASVTGNRAVTGTHGIVLEADMLFEEADYSECNMIVLPGGLPGAYNLRDHQGLEKKIKEFASEGKGIAAICAAPLVLGAHGILEGKKATIYPGMEENINGAEVLSFPVVRDMNIITSQGPATAMKFAIAIVNYFKGEETGQTLENDLLMM